MQFTEQVENGIFVIVPKGNLVVGSAEQLYAHIGTTLTHQTITGFVINLKEVVFVDSTGIGALAFLYKKYQNHHIDLVLCEPNSILQEIFQSAQLDLIIKIFPSEEEALQSFEKSA